ncbi:MAG TPA: serine hydrolase domain-containing protein [Terrimesophilobacter sp.]|jgi:Beta-lactamase class C and other penicillin binding proteins|uniref:serine hydrolase domain-containing protein n=1 Tax=Terrimesophilobacter sp. TaxID=2906435 RepID=UPI002F9244E0
MTADVQGFVASSFEGVAEAFEKTFDHNPTMGAALAVRVEGTPVLDLWGGLADERTSTPWQENTTSVVFSCTKGLVSILAAHLAQQGRLDYEALVTDYWPEFGASGKESVRVKHLLSHQAGLSAPREDLTVEDITDWRRVVGVLQEQEPLWNPGEGHAYHAVTHGWLIGEVIRRITGISVGEYFRLAITAPLRADAWIGLPPEEKDRVAHLQVGSTLAEFIAAQAATRDPRQPDWPNRAMTLGGALSPALATPDGDFNDYRLQAAEIPAAGGIATARSLATIWSAVVTDTDNVRLLNDHTIATATRVQTEGRPVFDVPPPFPRWGMGFQLDSPARQYLTPRGFGHDGAGGQVAFADPEFKVGFAFTTNLMEALDSRGTAIVDALRSALRP